MRARNLRPDFFKDEDLADTSPLARLLYFGLRCMADRAGRLEERPRRIAAEVFPYDGVDIEALLAELAKVGKIVRYVVAEVRYIYLPGFADEEHFHKNERESVLPEPSAATVTVEVVLSMDSSLPGEEVVSHLVALPTPEEIPANEDTRENSRVAPYCSGKFPSAPAEIGNLKYEIGNTKSKRASPKKEPGEGKINWASEWVDAERLCGRDPNPGQASVFGRKLKEIGDFDPDVLRDTIAYMTEHEKGPGLLPYVYKDCKYRAEAEIFGLMTGVRRVR